VWADDAPPLDLAQTVRRALSDPVVEPDDMTFLRHRATFSWQGGKHTACRFSEEAHVALRLDVRPPCEASFRRDHWVGDSYSRTTRCLSQASRSTNSFLIRSKSPTRSG